MDVSCVALVLALVQPLVQVRAQAQALVVAEA